MATSQTLSSQVSMDTSPLSPHHSLGGESMNYSNMTLDAQPGQRNAVHVPLEQAQVPVQQRMEIYGSNEGQSQVGVPQVSKDNDKELEKILKQTRDKIKDLSFQSDDDSNYSSYSSTETGSNMPSVNWENELKQYEDVMPLKIKIGYFDALILYAEEDRDEAEKFRQHLINDIDIGPSGPVTAMLYDCPELTTLSGSKIGHLSLTVDRSTYVFMYLSKSFVRDKWMEFSSESCLMTAIYDEDKRWCVVPVYTEKRSTCSFKVPMGLNSLKGINYYNNDEFYKRGVARLIKDKVPQRIMQNEKHKIKQKQWLEEHKRKQIELREKQARVERAEEEKTEQFFAFMKEETEKLQQSGILGLHHSQSEGQISTPNHSLPHIASTNSLKDVLPQNPNVVAYFQAFNQQNRHILHGYTQEQMKTVQRYNEPQQSQAQVRNSDEQAQSRFPVREQGIPGSPSNNQEESQPSRDNPHSSVTYSLPTGNGVENVSIPKLLSDRIQSLSSEVKDNYVRFYLEQNGAYSQGVQASPDVCQPYQHVQREAQVQHSYSNPEQTSMNPAAVFNQPAGFNQPLQQMENPLDNAPMLSTTLNSVPGDGLGDPGNQPHFSALWSSSDNSTGYNSGGPPVHFGLPQGSAPGSLRNPRYDGNLPNTSLFARTCSVEEDGSSFPANSTISTTVKGAGVDEREKSHQPSYKGKPSKESREEWESPCMEQKIDQKKGQNRKREKHVHYTINVYNANAVQVGSQNVVKGGREREPDSEDFSEDEDEILPVKINDFESKDLSNQAHSTEVLKKDPALQGDRDKQGTRGETEDRVPTNQPLQGSYNMDAASSSLGSQPMANSNLEQPQAHVTKQKVIDEEIISTSADQSLANPTRFQGTNHEPADNLVTTNQLPEGMQKFFAGNLDASVSVEKSSLKDKIITDQMQNKDNSGIEIKRQDSKVKSEGSTVVAIISPMRPKIPSESGECTEVKQLVPSEETALKNVVASSETQSIQRSDNNPVQLLTKGFEDFDIREQCDSYEENTPYNAAQGAASNLEHTSHEYKDTFKTKRFTNPSELFYPNRNGTGSRSRISPVPYGIDAASHCRDQALATSGAASEGFTPATGRFSTSMQLDENVEYDMCDSFEGTMSTSKENTTSQTNTRQRQVPSGKKQCVIS